MSTLLAEPPVPRRAVGRPRKLSLDAIVDAACELGLDGIEMAALAERLGTAVGTLYSYVRNREHLLRLVAKRLSERYRVEDVGQSWQDLLRDHAAMASAVFGAMPHLIGDLLSGDSVSEEQDYAQRLIGMLAARGFTRAEAIAIYIEMTQIVIGAAVCARRRDTHEAADAAAGRRFTIPELVGDHRPTLERVIREIEQGRAAGWTATPHDMPDASNVPPGS